MTRYGALIALALTVTLSSCVGSERRRGAGGTGGAEEESGGTDGSITTGITGGATGTGGKTSTGGSTGTGGSTSSGGSTGTADASASGGSGGTPDAGGKADMAASAWPTCLYPVFSGVMPSEFCMVYAQVCTFTGQNHYASMPDCMAKFRGGSNDGDACKSGHLCRAVMMPAMKEADCASSGTASCRN